MCSSDLTPMPEPISVTVVDPVACLLLRRKELVVNLSVETDSVKVHKRRPLVNKSARLAIALWLALHPTDVSDAHVLCSQALTLLKRAANVNVDSPTFEPASVTLAEPVETWLRARNEDKLLALNDMDCVAVPARIPTLTAIRRVCNTPGPALQ